MFPYLDLAGFTARTVMPAGDVQYLETDSPGVTAQFIALESSYINGRLRKRYGNSGGSTTPPLPPGSSITVTTPGNSLPFGQTAPLLLAAGSSPPGAQLSGRPTAGSIAVRVTVTTPGGLGVAAGQVSYDGGVSFSPLGIFALNMGLSYGLSLSFQSTPSPIWSADNIYSAATPVPEIILSWLTTLVTFRMYRRRGVNPQDPMLEMLEKEVEGVRKEIQEAADSKDGLWDLPTSEDLDSAVTTGGPLGFTDASPYAWQDRQANAGYGQDGAQFSSTWPWRGF